MFSFVIAGYKVTLNSALASRHSSATMEYVVGIFFRHNHLLLPYQVFDTNYNGYSTEELFFVSNFSM
jgi:hypothetical protein